MAVVTVHPADAPPVRFKGTIWIRSGPRRGIASADDERRLNEKRRFRDLSPDIRPITAAGIEVLDEMLFRSTYLPAAVTNEVLEQNQRTFEEQLIALRLAHPEHPPLPTLLGTLTIGKSPTHWCPCAYIQFLRVDGNALGDPVKDSQEIKGPLPNLMTELDDILKANIRTSVDFTSDLTEKRYPDYPLVALQQILRNAILHRSYENTNAPVRFYWFRDRIEVQNPGGPYGQVSKANFGKIGAYDYRNPNLAVAMKDLGYVQRFGLGIITAQKEMEKNGNPPPEFIVDDESILVILRSKL